MSVKKAHRRMMGMYGFVITLVFIGVLLMFLIFLSYEMTIPFMIDLILSPFLPTVLMFCIVVYFIYRWDQRDLSPKKHKLSRRERKWERQMEKAEDEAGQ